MGLDYDAAHLAADGEKLINSEVNYPYLVHFSRECLLEPQAERVLLQPAPHIKTIYVRTLHGELHYKFLADNNILADQHLRDSNDGPFDVLV